MTLDAGRETRSRSALELIGAWDGLGVVARHDADLDAWFFVAMHDDTLGTPVGGCRMRVYERPEHGLLDAMRLAEGMTAKWASIGLGFGGGKSVIALSRAVQPPEREGVIRRFGALLNTLNGAFGTGEDLGTTPADMKLLSQVTPHVVGISRDVGGPVDPGPYTALGVFSGMRAALSHRFGTNEVTGRSVLVQGVGDVGAPLARMIASAGGRVLLSDIDEAKVEALTEELGATVVSPDDVYGTECDVYAPCALGATLNQRTIPMLRCSIVAGSANNQLETEEDARRLLDRDLLYAPDYVINAGGAMAFGLMYKGLSEPDELEPRVASLEASLAEIFTEAAAEGISPLVAARRRVERVLASA